MYICAQNSHINLHRFHHEAFVFSVVVCLPIRVCRLLLVMAKLLLDIEYGY